MRQAPALAELLVLRAFLPCCGPKRRGCGSRISWRAFPAYPRRKARQRMAYHRPAGLALFWGKGKFYRIDLFLVQRLDRGRCRSLFRLFGLGGFFRLSLVIFRFLICRVAFLRGCGLRSRDILRDWLVGFRFRCGAGAGCSIGWGAGCCGASCGSGCGCAACCSARLG